MTSEANPPADPRPAPSKRYRVLARLESPLTKLTGLTCRDFARLTVARMDRPLSFQENVRHRVHGVMCTLCRSFSGQFDDINELIREASAENIVAQPDDESATANEIEVELEGVAIDRINAVVRNRINPATR